MTTRINWENTLVAPLARKGFQPCYLEIPARLSHNGQISAEYVNHAIKKVVREHPAAANDVSIISWVKRHIALGASYRGSWSMIPLFYFNLFSEAVVQQLPWSKFVATLLKFGGGTAQVPTTNIGSSTNLIVQPSFYGGSVFGRKDSWRLDGPKASNIDLFKVCTSRLITAGFLPRPFAHESLLWEPASRRVIFDALSNDDSSLGNSDVVSVDECKPDSAPYLKAGDRGQHAKIVPELLDFSPTMPTSGWPDVPLRDYASGLQLTKEEEEDNHGKKEI
ncbi:Lipase B [Seiridium cupressi]